MRKGAHEMTMRREVKRGYRTLRTLLVTGMISGTLFFSGCGVNKADLQKQIEELQQQTAQLRSENENLLHQIEILNNTIKELTSGAQAGQTPSPAASPAD
jgi:cell division protein FtsB